MTTVDPAPKERWSFSWKHLYDEVVTSGLCTGCAGCVIACPHDVLSYDDAIGVYKEVRDSRGGSGFSFNDMAANRAGTRFGLRSCIRCFRSKSRRAAARHRQRDRVAP